MLRTRHGSGRKVKVGLGLLAAVVAGALWVAGGSSPATAAAPGVSYDNMPAPIPGNLPSFAYEAQSASEIGGAIQLTTLPVTNPVITVLMSSWGCQNGHWYDGTCSTTPGATFSVPITLNVRAVGGTTDGSAPGALLLSKTQTFNIPFRPSADNVNCTGPNAGKWFHAGSGSCFNGLATPITFNVPGSLGAPQAVVSIAFNTTHYGATPVGEGAACFTSPAGCGYDSLNLALSTAAPSVGSQPLPSDLYINSSWTGAYCSAPFTGQFVLSTGCNFGQPAITVRDAVTQTVLVANPSIVRIGPGLKLYLTLSGRLTTQAGAAIAGETIKFAAFGGTVCSAATDANGDAACGGVIPGVLASVLSLGYKASYAGNPGLGLQPATAEGVLIKITLG